MSNYLAIATVTATLQRMLQAIVQIDVDGARVTTVRPDNIGKGTPETGVNLYLYHVIPNLAWRNSDLRTRFSDGQMSKRPQAALDLHYLFTCYGNEIELEAQRLLGSVVRTLHARPILTREIIRDTIADSTFPFLVDSNLADQIETVKFMPLSLSVEELSNIWSVFFQTPHALSIAYQASVILIESDDIPMRALPIRDRSKFSASPFGASPVIEKVASQAGKLEPILADSTLIIQGHRLRAKTTKVRIGNAECTPKKVSDKEVILELTSVPISVLRAGIQGLQIIHPVTDRAGLPNRGVESNVVALVLRPNITQITLSQWEGIDNELRSAKLKVRVNFTMGKGQKVVLLLNELSTDNPVAYLFDAALNRPSDTDLITLAIYDVKAGEYLVRVQIDGAESLLTVDNDSESPTFEQYIGPIVRIP